MMLRNGVMLGIVAVALILGACQQRPVGGADSTADRLNPGETRRGELTSRSSYNVNDGSRFQRFAVPLQAGQVARFELTGALQGSLSLHTPEGEFLAASQGGADRMSLSHRADEAGLYLLAVSGLDHRSYGPFRVSSRLLSVAEGGPIEAGEERAGWLDGVVDTYTLAVTEAGLYQIIMRSEALDAYLTLRGRTDDGDPIHQEDDDSAGGLDARLTAYLLPGHYDIDAGWTQQQSRGLYTLAVETLPVPEGVSLRQSGPLRPGETVEGWMAGAALTYTLVVEALSRVQIDMTSPLLDPYLELAGNGVAHADDDGGEDLNARIDALLAPGTYQVMASDISGQEGLFELSATVAPFVLAEAVNGLPSLRPGADSSHRLIADADHYRLIVPEPGRYIVEMRSQELDAFLELYGDAGAWLDDDGGTGTDARLNVDLPAGEYLLIARAFSPEQGAYQLQVRRQ
ncbi:hypothetical protein [Isoalcanivorax indicus]|uniref:hypothetical protein n=1 Tax=Isoalcanivorax indicus TaxID=2202653 RepID=UPI0013C42666|nr:hypothetical protein [Isoalcanivorax indicus]